MTDFEALANSQFTGECPANYDGVAYQYEITRDGKEYALDSCTEDIGEEPLFEALAEYFDFFGITHDEIPE
jgi:hypothetical protein